MGPWVEVGRGGVGEEVSLATGASWSGWCDERGRGHRVPADRRGVGACPVAAVGFLVGDGVAVTIG